MLEYQGNPCHYCGKEFEDGDDIVVCPECGTPYHRACYREAGHCTNTVLHESGGSWQKERRDEMAQQRREEKRAEEEQQALDRERGEGPQMIHASLYDGVRMNPDDPTVGLDPNEDFEGTTLGEIAEFVSVNRFYYLPLFRLMKKTGKKLSLNLVCLLFPELQFAYRKMWGFTLLTVFLRTLLGIPQAMLTMSNQFGMRLAWADITTVGFGRLITAANLVEMFASFGLCLFGNYLYYRYTLRKIKRLRTEASSELHFRYTLREEGGASIGNVFLALLIEGACIFEVSMLLMLL